MSSLAILDDFRRTFLRTVLPIIAQILGKSPLGFLEWLYRPFWYTLQSRRNFFRSGLLINVGKFGNCQSMLPSLAACVEIAWTCALILDDIIDGSQEREGQICAYVIHGRVRCILAAAATLVHMFFWMVFKIRGNIKLRIARVSLSIILFLKCLRTQLGKSRYKSLEEYRIYSREINLSIHWALLAPFCGDGNKVLTQLLKAYANHSAIAGKMRNDILDYWGSSSERDAVFEDFRSRKISLPIFLLLNVPLQPEDLKALHGHFYGASTLPTQNMMKILFRYQIHKESLSLLTSELNASQRILKYMRTVGVPTKLIECLERWNAYMVVDWTTLKIYDFHEGQNGIANQIKGQRATQRSTCQTRHTSSLGSA